MSRIADIFRKNLREALRERGSKQRLAKKSGIAPNLLWAYVEGRNVPGLEAIERIANALETDPLILLTDRSDSRKTDAEIVQEFMRAWSELKARSEGDEDFELFLIAEHLFRYYFEKRKLR